LGSGEDWVIAFGGADGDASWIDVGDNALVMRRDQAGLVARLVELTHPRFIYPTRR
jgi:hypothetical protein